MFPNWRMQLLELYRVQSQRIFPADINVIFNANIQDPKYFTSATIPIDAEGEREMFYSSTRID